MYRTPTTVGVIRLKESPPMEKPGANEKRNQVRAALRERMAEVASQKCYRIKTRLYIGNQVPVARPREATSPRAATEERTKRKTGGPYA